MLNGIVREKEQPCWLLPLFVSLFVSLFVYSLLADCHTTDKGAASRVSQVPVADSHASSRLFCLGVEVRQLAPARHLTLNRIIVKHGLCVCD